MGGIVMAKIIYKKGCEGQNKLSCIEGIEIVLINDQKALIYPKYAERQMLKFKQIGKWDAHNETGIEALKVEDAKDKSRALLMIGSPSAEWVSQFCSDEYGIFCLPSLLAALEIYHQNKEIDTLAETIEGADLLRDYIIDVWSCSRCRPGHCWCAIGRGGYASINSLYCFCLAVPLVLYR